MGRHLFTSVATGHYCVPAWTLILLYCADTIFLIWLNKFIEKSFWSLEENIKMWVDWKPPSFPAFLNLLTWDALPTNKCSCLLLKHFVEGQNLPRRRMDKFNWQYKNCHIPMISAAPASLRQDKVLGRGGTRVVVGGGRYRVAGRFLSLENVVTDFYFPQWHACIVDIKQKCNILNGNRVDIMVTQWTAW